MLGTSLDKPSGILNPRASAQVFHLGRHLPSPGLAKLIERYWIVRWDLRGRAPYVQETLPHPSINVVFEEGRSDVFGVMTKKFARRLEGAGQVFGIKFKPGAFFPLVQRPVCELTDREIDVRQVFTGDIDALERAILALDDDAAQVALVEAFLSERLPAADQNVELVTRAVQLILKHREITRVDDIAARVDMSPRTLQRLFRQYVGVSPKWVIRRYRLHEAADRLAEGHVVDQTTLALDLGYCDQAHFIKDFTALVGRSPAGYAAGCARRDSP